LEKGGSLIVKNYYQRWDQRVKKNCGKEKAFQKRRFL